MLDHVSIRPHGKGHYMAFDADGHALSGPAGSFDMAMSIAENALKQRAKRSRPCLCCSQTFLSEGPHNRMCDNCRTLSTGPF